MSCGPIKEYLLLRGHILMCFRGIGFFWVVLKGYILYLCPNILNYFIRVIDIQTHQSVEKFDICSYIFWKTWLSKGLVDKELLQKPQKSLSFVLKDFLNPMKRDPFWSEKDPHPYKSCIWCTINAWVEPVTGEYQLRHIKV